MYENETIESNRSKSTLDFHGTVGGGGGGLVCERGRGKESEGEREREREGENSTNFVH
jgi:hypothetical protein